jgi:dienelactone hydrolase
MSSTSGVPGHSKACCNTPAVVATGYNAKGTYEQLAGYKTYVTGSPQATKGIISIYDVFGYFEQTVQGADILAEGDENHKYKVFIPDWFKGEPLDIGCVPTDTPEKKEKLMDFITKHKPASVASQLPDVVKALSAANPQITSWGVVGYCWGGKVVSLAVTNGATNPFAIAAEVHPGMVESADAAGIKVPVILLASGEEPEDKVREFEKALTVPKHVEIFKDQVHGWMAARADLSDDRVRAEYARGYKTLLEFFAKHWA